MINSRKGALEIISSCYFTYVGLEAISQHLGQFPIRFPNRNDIPALSTKIIICQVYDNDTAYLELLLSLADILRRCQENVRLLIMATVLPDWFHGTLAALVRDFNVPPTFKMATTNPRCSVDTITCFLREKNNPNVVPVRGRCSYLTATGLSRMEMKVLLARLQGVPMNELSVHTGLSRSTLYFHQWKGKRKLRRNHLRRGAVSNPNPGGG